MIELKIEQLLEEKFKEEEYADCFIIDISLNVNKKLEVFIDCDSSLTFQKCQRISRYLESYIDEEGGLGEKYTLEVSSPGVARPLKLPRQYVKNIGRELDVKYNEEDKMKGKLIAADDEKITLEYVEVTRIKKKKIKETKTLDIPYGNIRKAKVKISFR